MADQRVNPLFKLPKEVQDRLKALEPDITQARKILETMKGLGMDTKELEERLDWSEKVKLTLLKEFT
jgi:hypothetical protein